MRRFVVAPGLMVLLAACASPPPVDPPTDPIALQDQWGRTTTGATVDTTSRWWSALGNAQLDSTVEAALAENLRLDVAVANVRAARANARIAGADRWPRIDASARGSRSKQIFVGLPIPGDGPPSSISTTYALSLESSWEVDLWNRLGKQAQAAVAELQATEADRAGSRLSVAAQTARAWLTATEARLQRDLARRSLEAWRRTEDVALRRYRRGLIAAVDVHLARSQTESATAELENREEQVRRSRRMLEVLLGRYPRGAIEAGDALPEPGTTPPAGLPAQLLARRPDLVAAERRLVASGARVGLAQRNLLPRISLTASTGTTSDQLSDLLDGDFSVWSFVGNLLQPVFQGGRLLAQVEANRAQEAAALARYAQAALDAFAEVENALESEVRLAARAQHLAEALEASRSAWRLAEDRYRRGVGDLLQVLESQRGALQLESALTNVRAERARRRVDLHVALGGGFQPSPSSSAR